MIVDDKLLDYYYWRTTKKQEIFGIRPYVQINLLPLFQHTNVH